MLTFSNKGLKCCLMKTKINTKSITVFFWQMGSKEHERVEGGKKGRKFENYIII